MDNTVAEAPPTQVVAETKPEIQKPAVVRSKDIALDQHGVLAPKTHTEAWRIAETMLSSKALPAHFENAAQVFMAQQMLRGLGLDPVVGIRQVANINGTFSIWGDLPLALVRQSEKLAWVKEQLFDREYKEISVENKNLNTEAFIAVCTAQRVGEPEPVSRFFTLDDAKKAGLIDKNRSVWKVYPKRMLRMRARTECLKDLFPEILNGVAVAEYDHDYIPGTTQQSSNGDFAQEINKEFLEAEKTDV